VLEDVNVFDTEALTLAINDAESLLKIKEAEKNNYSKYNKKAHNQLEMAQNLLIIFENKQKTQQQLDGLEKQRQAIKQDKEKLLQAEKAAKIHPKWENLQQLETDCQVKKSSIQQLQIDIDKARKRVASAEANFITAQKNYQQRDELKAQEMQLQNYQQELITYEQVKQSAVDDKQAYESNLDKKIKSDTQLSQLELSAAGFDKNIVELEDKLSTHTIIVKQEIRAKEVLEQTKMLYKAKVELDKLAGIHKKCEKTFITLSNNINVFFAYFSSMISKVCLIRMFSAATNRTRLFIFKLCCQHSGLIRKPL